MEYSVAHPPFIIIIISCIVALKNNSICLPFTGSRASVINASLTLPELSCGRVVCASKGSRGAKKRISGKVMYSVFPSSVACITPKKEIGNIKERGEGKERKDEEDRRLTTVIIIFITIIIIIFNLY